MQVQTFGGSFNHFARITKGFEIGSSEDFEEVISQKIWYLPMRKICNFHQSFFESA